MDGGVAASCHGVQLGEFGPCAGEADLEPLEFPEPALTLGLGDAVVEVGEDLDQP